VRTARPITINPDLPTTPADAVDRDHDRDRDRAGR
jgi:hypothetical protein